MLVINILCGLDLPLSSAGYCDSYCVVKYFGKEIGRSEPCPETQEPFWNWSMAKPVGELNGKETEQQRPFVFEFLHVEVLHASESLGETRIPLHTEGRPEWYRLLQTCSSKSTNMVENEFRGRILVDITITHSRMNKDYCLYRSMHLVPLRTLLPDDMPQYRHLYIDFNWNPGQVQGMSMLPGPRDGEVVLDRFDGAEVKHDMTILDFLQHYLFHYFLYMPCLSFCHLIFNHFALFI